MSVNLLKISTEILNIIKETGWTVKSYKRATRGSVYIEIFRVEDEKKEWAVIRVADHKQVYQNWITLYSVTPMEISVETMRTILKFEFGKVGDIL